MHVPTPRTGTAKSGIEPDEVNQATWRRVADEFAVEGWSDPGEPVAMQIAAQLVRGRPALDLGVGGGRTVNLMRLITDDYVAMDYSEAMVDLCRSRHPDVDVLLGDARDLGRWDSRSLGFVSFSNNGLDAVGHDDRARVINEVSRVLEPGGVFLVSALNKEGPLWSSGPADVPDLPWQPGSLLPATTVSHPPRADWGAAVASWRRLKRSTVDGDGWGLGPMAAHGYGLLTHFITVQALRDELQGAGLDVLTIVPCDASRPLEPGETSTAMFVHAVAVRQAQG